MYIWQRPTWPSFTWDNEKILKAIAEIRYVQGRFMGFVSTLSSSYLKEAQELLLAEDRKFFNKNEGLYIKSDSTDSALARHAGLPTDRSFVGDTTKITYHEIALDDLYNRNEPLTIERILDLHKAILGNAKGSGKLRGEIKLKVTSELNNRTLEHFEAPPRSELVNELQRLVDWINIEAQEIDSFIAAAITLLWLLTLMPFNICNDHIGRILSNIFLMQIEGNNKRLFLTTSSVLYSKQDIKAEAYSHVLEHCQKGNLDITQWIIWFGERFKEVCNSSLYIMMPVFRKTKFWLTYDNAAFTTRQMNLINDMIMQSDRYKNGISKGEFTEITGMSGPSAYRELIDLVEKGCMVAIGGPKRGRRYILKDIATDLFRF